MAAPVTKRRKLRHDSDNGSESEGEAGGVPSAPFDSGSHTPAFKEAQPKPSHTKSDLALQDGVYTSEVFKSNIFKLQVDELLDQVRFKYGKKTALVETAMRKIKTIIEQLPSREPLPIVDAETALRSEGVAVPFPNPRPPKDAKYKLQYERPSNINVTGSFPLKTATRTDGDFAIDLVVTMPKTLFQEKDYLNYRYFYKRAYYLACVAAGIQNSKAGYFKTSFDCLNGNQLQPVLVVHPSGDNGADDFSSSKCVVRILLAIPENTFPESKLRPGANCIRSQFASEEETSNAAGPTPFYNATLQSDVAVTPYLKLLHSAAAKCEAFKDACILGRIWLRQRGFGSRIRKGGFGNFEWAALMAVLLQPTPGAGTPPLSTGYSSYQLFKATLQFLVKHSLTRTPYGFNVRDVTFPKTNFAPVFFDGPRNLNLLFKMTPWSYSRLQNEAKATIDMLGDSTADHFESTFILKADLLTFHYDAVLRIPLSSLEVDPVSEDYDEALLEKLRSLYNTLTRALTDRVTTLDLLAPDHDTWEVALKRPPESQHKSVLVVLSTSPSNANRTVDLGPAAENKKEAASFRQFWGEKAELRRFKDGSILESVVWSVKDTSVPVMEQIIKFTLKKYISAQAAERASFTFDSYAAIIPSGRVQGQSGVFAFSARMNALANLEKDIRGLEGLPLQIRHIKAADPQLRYSAVDVDSMRTPASIVIQFEVSARWPDDLCAIQRTKVAFFLKLSDLLAEERPEYVTRVGLENQSSPSKNQAYLDIILPSGFSFRLRIQHEREATLLERQLKDKTLDNQSRESAASALAIYNRDYVHVPAHTQALQTLCTRYPALSPSIRLTKRWFASHLLSSHFSTELIELMVVRTFLQPYPWGVPSTATTGFLRTLLWMSRWDWRHVPLVVDFSSSVSAPSGELGTTEKANGSLGTQELQKIQTRFEAWRHIDPAMNRVVLFAATNLDNDGTTWSDRGNPEKVVAARMTALSRVATNVLRAHEDSLIAYMNGKGPGEDLNPFKPESLFVSDLGDYDIIIRLSSRFSTKSTKKTEPKFKNLAVQQGSLSEEDKRNVGYAPAALFAEDLRQIYGDAVLWLWNPENFDVIAGLWNPMVTARRSWKVKPGWNSMPQRSAKDKEGEEEDAGADIDINKGAICNEIKRLGGEMIASIELRN
ncbi:pre-rRNA processing protein Utp22 [Westerdykella ornata]|uniref:U3 small nucleolar RNA-associated protein 22 n=1 Tax=Westerdykella ornata TaxID=318751 RepID=A0A6A6JLU1_WESOR|nr:pre-rRNA processing protein Utp22 [Westerdykella ornata]KAF2277561.1 pre-rRNA processing protein Utp22 [Westerdykella ornata]